MKFLSQKTSGVLVAGILTMAVALPAFAQVNIGVGTGLSVTANSTSSTVGARIGARLGTRASGTVEMAMINRAETRGNAEITARINALNSLSGRINAMIHVSDSDKSSLSASIQSQISELTQLQSQISVDASSSATSSLKADVQSITKAYRVYMLVLPQAEIAAASDRVMTIVSMFQTIGTKLQARITAAQASGTDVTAMQSSYTDFTAKIADAQTQAQAAVSETASLMPDNGATSTMESNTATLKDARAKIQTAQKDLVTARQDAGSIAKALIAIKGSATVDTTVTATTTASGTGY